MAMAASAEAGTAAAAMTTVTATLRGTNMLSDEWRQQYREYLRSPEWQRKRQAAFAHYGRECQWCGDKKRLQVHHLHYRTLGSESPEDLEILCPGCHADADIRRARESEARSAAALYEAQLDGWASEKYGEEWEDHCDVDSVECEFLEWLERQESD